MGGGIIDYIRLNTSMPVGYYLIAVCIGIVLILATKKWNISILVPYMFLVLAATVLTRNAGESAKYHLRLFWSYGSSFRYQKNQILANVVMFAPIGILLWFEKKKWSVVYGVLFSILIELTQLITHRGMFELDDVLHNTVGLMIGFSCTAGITLVVRNIRARRHRG